MATSAPTQLVTPESLGMSDEIIAQFENDIRLLDEAKAELGKAILGQDDLLEHIILALMAGGHALFVGVPGTGKTMLATALGTVFGLTENRVQCTPDLMPADILGSEVLEIDGGTRSFRFIPGPIFAQIVLGDELNRASARTQSATLQAMQEGMVTAGGQAYRLPKPFHFIATQNPIDQEGTNPLPEAQKDRFLIEYDIPYPDEEAEWQIGIKTTTTQHSWEDIYDRSKDLEPPANQVVSPKSLKQVFDSRALIGVQHAVRKLPMLENVYGTALKIVRASRPEYRSELERLDSLQPDERERVLSNIFNYAGHYVDFGAGTRAVQAFSLMTRARAMRRGDFTPNLDDVKELALPILRHRIIPNYAARTEMGVRTNAQAVEKIVQEVVAKLIP